MFKLLRTIQAKLPAMPTQPPAHELQRLTLLQLSCVIGIAIIAHFSIANLAIALFASFIFLLKVLVVWFNKKSPPSIVMATLLLFSIGIVIFFYGGWNGQVAGISFIVLLVSLKFLESRILRDYYIVCLLLYFLAASSFLFNASIFNIILVIVYTIVITAFLFRLSTPSKLHWKLSFKESGRIILIALPLALFLFFSFPRIHGSFGFLPSQDKSEGQGLEDSLVAGEMASSAFDNSLAFRVQFKGEIPPRNQLYWRSKVMPVERNFQWEVLSVDKRDFLSSALKVKALDITKGQYKYDILHEPSRDKFIPYLDYVAGIERGQLLDDYAVFDEKPKGGIFTYSGSSTLSPSLPASRKLNEALLLTTESVPNARLQALINQWRRETNSQQELVQKAFNYFNEQPFNYSLTPPTLDEQLPIDDFIFNSRTGYCEHFASAFTILMRWSGIPSRIVVGYQGGTLNKAGNYLEVKYSDAHAWSEVWINNQWQRVDPTSAISPERIEFGMDALLELWDGTTVNNSSAKSLSNILNPTGSAKYLQQMRDSWNNISYQWNKWVVNYDQAKQLQLLEKLGFKHKNSLITLVSIIVVGLAGFMLFYFWQLIPKPARLNDVQKTYQKFAAKLAKHQINKLDSDTPTELQDKAISKFPEYDSKIRTIVNCYLVLRYGKPNEQYEKQVTEFKRHVKQFKIVKN